MGRIVIAGAGDFGRELMMWLRHEGREGRIVFLDDKCPTSREAPVIGCIGEAGLVLNDDDTLFVAIADPKQREDVTQRLANWPVSSYTHRLSLFTASAFAVGTLTTPFSLVSRGCKLGEGLILNTGASVGHDCTIGAFVTVSSNVSIGGHVKIGKRVFLGTGAIICPEVEIGDDAHIGAGAVVIKNVAAGARVFGNPAKAYA